MPTITFQVNLNQVNTNNIPAPGSSTDPSSNLPSTFSTWFPDLLRDNRALKHGTQFTATGLYANYLLNNYTSGSTAILTVVSNVASI